MRGVVLLEFEVHVLTWCLCPPVFLEGWRQAVVIWGLVLASEVFLIGAGAAKRVLLMV